MLFAPDGRVIATYDNRGKALRALVKTTKALEGVTSTQQSPVIIQNRMGGFPVFKILFILLLLVVGVAVYKNAMQSNIALSEMSVQNNDMAESEKQMPPSADEPKAGVPLSAEEYLNQR